MTLVFFHFHLISIEGCSLVLKWIQFKLVDTFEKPEDTDIPTLLWIKQLPRILALSKFERRFKAFASFGCRIIDHDNSSSESAAAFFDNISCRSPPLCKSQHVRRFFKLVKLLSEGRKSGHTRNLELLLLPA